MRRVERYYCSDIWVVRKMAMNLTDVGNRFNIDLMAGDDLVVPLLVGFFGQSTDIPLSPRLRDINPHQMTAKFVKAVLGKPAPESVLPLIQGLDKLAEYRYCLWSAGTSFVNGVRQWLQIFCDPVAVGANASLPAR